MIRTGGLSLPEVFNRVRLRSMSEQGAQGPMARRKDRCAVHVLLVRRMRPAPAAPVSRRGSRQPIRDLGAPDAYAAALERDTMQGYEDFLIAYSQRFRSRNGCGQLPPRGVKRLPGFALTGRHAASLLVVPETLSARSACR